MFDLIVIATTLVLDCHLLPPCVQQSVDIWRHSALLSSWRARAEIIDNDWLRNLLGCPYCLSVCLSLCLTGVCLIETLLRAQAPWTLHALDPRFLFWLLLLAARLPIAGLAISQLANRRNDRFYNTSRIVRHNR